MNSSLFVIQTCPVGENYRKNFLNFWTFERLLREKPENLNTLAVNILSTNQVEEVDLESAKLVKLRIDLCLSLSPDDYTSITDPVSAQIIIEKLSTKEEEIINLKKQKKSRKK